MEIHFLVITSTYFLCLALKQISKTSADTVVRMCKGEQKKMYVVTDIE